MEVGDRIRHLRYDIYGVIDEIGENYYSIHWGISDGKAIKTCVRFSDVEKVK